jgi:hypothetical protein
MNSMPRFCVIAALFVDIALPSFAADVTTSPRPAVAIGGMVQQAQSLTIEDLEKFPQTPVQIAFVSGHGQETGTFTGALLWTVLGNAGLVDATGKNGRLRHTIMVTGRDGYGAALSLGEIDPDFEAKSVILATMKDGKPLGAGDGIRLVVPNDRHGGRAVRDVVDINVR